MKKKGFNEIQGHWLDSTLVRVDDHLIITHERDCPIQLMRIREMMLRLVRSSGPQFRAAKMRQGGARFVPTRLGKAFLGCFSINRPAIRAMYPLHRLDPYFELFDAALGATPALSWSPRASDVDGLNAFVERLQQQAKESGFVTVADRARRAAEKNASELTKFVDAQFDHHAKLLMVRLDCGYEWDLQKVACRWIVTAGQIKRHRKLFLRYLRRKFPTLVGYIWKIEYQAAKSFHVHWILIFNGALRRQGVTLGKIAGEYWKNVVTKGLGSYWNVNRYEREYEQRGLLGIGMIRHSDYARRERLAVVLRYLAKVDYFVRLEDPGLKKTMGKSFVKTSAEKARKRGRPRKNSKADMFLRLTERLSRGPMKRKPA